MEYKVASDCSQVQKPEMQKQKQLRGPVRIEHFKFDEEVGLSYDGVFIADFDAAAIEVRVSLEDEADRRILIEVRYSDGRPPKRRWIKDLKRIDFFSEFQANDTFLLGDARMLLLYKLMHEAAMLPNNIDLTGASGLYKLTDGRKVFVIGDNVIGEPNLSDGGIDGKTSIPIIIPITRKEEGNEGDKLRRFATLIPEATVILFFFSMYAVVRPFVENVCNRGGCVLALIAPSGHLKTTLARLYCLSPDQAENEISFTSTVRTQNFLARIQRKSGQIVLYDDLHKVKSSEINRKQEERLDAVVRCVCDTGSGSANGIITGESIRDMGIFSALDRLLFVEIPTMNGEQIEKLKEKITGFDQDLMARTKIGFVTALMEHYDDVLQDIDRFFRDVQHSHEVTKEGNAVRTYGYALLIQLAEYLFSRYYMPLGIKEILNTALKAQNESYEKVLRAKYESEKQRDYVVDFFETICKGGSNIRFFSNYTSYDSAEKDKACFVRDNMLYITSGAVETAFFERYKRPISAKQIMKELHEQRILMEEDSARGFQKNYRRKKYYVVNIPTLLSRLVDSGYDVPERFAEEWLMQTDRAQ